MNRRVPVPSHRTISAARLRIAVAASRFNDQITTRLVQGAVECLRHHGSRVSPSDVVWCPGAFELPLVADQLARSSRWDAIICLGAVIRGETPHFEYVSAESARGIQDVALRRGVPVIFGVLTTNTERQARERAGGKHGNKGWDAALAAIDMIEVLRSIRRRKRR